MERTEIEIIVGQMEEQNQSIQDLKKSIEVNKFDFGKVDELITKNNFTAGSLVELAKRIIEEEGKISKQIKSISSQLPLQITKTYHFDRQSRNEIFMASIMVAFVFVMSIVTINYYKDHTNYKKAWIDLYESHEWDDRYIQHFDNVLRRNSEENFFGITKDN
jgi:hypothetical protein